MEDSSICSDEDVDTQDDGVERVSSVHCYIILVLSMYLSVL